MYKRTKLALEQSTTTNQTPKVILDYKNFFYKGDKKSSYDRVWKTDNYCGTLICAKKWKY